MFYSLHTEDAQFLFVFGIRKMSNFSGKNHNASNGSAGNKSCMAARPRSVCCLKRSCKATRCLSQNLEITCWGLLLTTQVATHRFICFM